MASDKMTLGALGAIALVAIAAVGGAFLYASGTASQGDGTSTVTEKVTLDQLTVRLKAGYTLGNGSEILMFKQSEAPEKGFPEYWGDYMDFDTAEATKGLQQGVDYYRIDMDGLSQHDVDGVEPGMYDIAVVDGSGNVVHDSFVRGVKIPAEVEAFKLDRDYQHLVSLNLDGYAVADGTASDDVSDNTHVLVNNNVVDINGQLIPSSNNDFATQQRVVHTATVEDNVFYLGDVDLGSIDAENTSATDVERAQLVDVQVDSTTQSALEGIRLDGDYNLNSDVLGTTDNPAKAANQIRMVAEFEVEDDFDGSGTSPLLTATVEDIYGQTVTTMSVTQ